MKLIVIGIVFLLIFVFERVLWKAYFNFCKPTDRLRLIAKAYTLGENLFTFFGGLSFILGMGSIIIGLIQIVIHM